MTMTRLQLQTEIYEIMSKTASAAGLLTPTKVNTAIQDALDYISAKMLKINGGWLTRLVYANVTGNSPYVTIPSGLSIINFIKYKTGTDSEYVPINFNENADGASDFTSGTGATGGLPVWRFSNSMILLEPMPASTLANAVMIDGVYMPTALALDADNISGDLDNRVFTTYAKWRAASILRSLTTKDPPPWAMIEMEWKQACLEILARRSREPTPIRSFQRDV